jgi:aspartyl aminopeptidase
MLDTLNASSRAASAGATQGFFMQQAQYITALIDYLISSPTAFHAVASATKLLTQNGFTRLDEEKIWNRLPAGKYFVTRNDSSLIGFSLRGGNGPTSLQMIGAHTDSPCLKIKPNPVHYLQLGVEVYGGALLGPWFDRELSLAGRVSWCDSEGALQSALVDFKRPIGIIPSLAIHLDRDANKKREINKQTDLVPIIGLTDDIQDQDGFQKILQKQVCTQYPDLDPPDVTDHELFFYDANPPALTGLASEFITSGRLDNLLSCFAAVQALLAAGPAENCLIILNDHEEVGSVSSCGAQGPFLRDILERLLPEVEKRQTALRSSLLISADNAHGAHPNFADKHDPRHLPQMNHGPVIKINANQRYATNARTAGRFRMLCRRAGVPVQEFVMRNDMACGSTIGPLTAAETGVDTVDVGIASLAMHSIRETAACTDCWYLYRVLQTFFNSGQ